MKNKFAVFIMVHGRPDNMKTYNTLRNQGYSGKIYLIGDSADNTIGRYEEIYGDELIVFDKIKESKKYDAGDNSGDLRSTMYSANAIFDLAEEKGIEYFSIMCDDYYDFYYALKGTKGKVVPQNMNIIFDLMIEYYKTIPAKSIAFAQTGDFIGGVDNGRGAYRFSKRKVMNTFICSTKRRFEFLGRMNEDVTTYVNLGQKGDLFLTIPVIAMGQPDTQKEKKGLTEMYTDNGTYVKSFFSVMYNPSCVKTSMMNANHKRIHHSIKWNNTTPMIINERHKKS